MIIKIKKAEISSTALFIILVLIVATISIIFSLGSIGSFKKTENKAEIESFRVTLENSLKNQRSKDYGSTQIISFSLPPNINQVCFTENNEMFSRESSLELTKSKELYKDQNIFFFPTEKYSPSKIDYLSINDEENPLCVDVVGGKLNLKLTALKNTTLVEASNQEDINKGCYVVAGSNLGNEKEKIDIVFLSFGYKNKTLFSEDVYDYTNNYLFQIEPFLSNKEKFNIWMIGDNQPECYIKGYIICDSLSVNKIASDCPNDYIFVLVDKSSLGNSIRSSAISNLAKINTRDNRLVLLHEFGHSFANLADEYTDSYYESWFDSNDYPNCDREKCVKWSSIEGTTCIIGCSTNNFYRSGQESIMRSYEKSSSFGILNEKIINKNLGEYK